MRSNKSAFTLVELLVVLTILALVTTMAVRSLDQIEDQRRFDSSQQSMVELSEAVLGSTDDGTASGFVADMGRLPRTASVGTLEIQELWINPAVPFDVRPATLANGVDAVHVDGQVLVSGGWRGPYLRLPIGAETLLDAWGNPVTSPETASPPNSDSTGYARLRDAADAPINTAGQPIRIVRFLGANGRRDNADTGYDRDETIAFTDDTFLASVIAQVEIVDNDSSPTTPDITQSITLRVFGPNPNNATQIVISSVIVPFSTNPVICTISDTVPIGPRAVRAYLHPEIDSSTAASTRRSTVRQVNLRAGTNLFDLTIDR